MNYKIVKAEPDGWDKAYHVYLNGELIAYFSFLDGAEYYIANKTE